MHVEQVLERAHIPVELFWGSGPKSVYLSPGNQLFSTKRNFDGSNFRAEKDYPGWEAHHILEFQDAQRLGIAGLLPPYDDQITVLLPPGGHRGRINSILRRVLPTGARISRSDIDGAYRLTYSTLGNYCGSSEQMITAELMSIVAVLTEGAH